MEAQIVGISLVRNEDVHIEQAIRNVASFVDRLIITDHQSTDETYEICKRLAIEFPKIDLRRIDAVAESARAIEPFVSTKTWIFVVDGDELFDPSGLQSMRLKLKRGDFDQFWTVYPNILHCVNLDTSSFTASGYMTPPARPNARLHNFAAIRAWRNCPERVHGPDIEFLPGYGPRARAMLHRELEWDESPFRYLHTCFLQRSKMQKVTMIDTRLNPNEVAQLSRPKSRCLRLIVRLRLFLLLLSRRDYKSLMYKRGPLVQKDVQSFFPDS